MSFACTTLLTIVLASASPRAVLATTDVAVESCEVNDHMLIQQRRGDLVPAKNEVPSAKESNHAATSATAPEKSAAANEAAPVALLEDKKAEDHSRAGLNARNSELHSQMAEMMADEDDDDLEQYMSNSRGRGGVAVGEDYMAASEGELSSALGSRWQSAELEANANHNSKALLEGIGGKKAMRSLQGMVNGMMAFR